MTITASLVSHQCALGGLFIGGQHVTPQNFNFGI
jgi:hypothetical protein